MIRFISILLVLATCTLCFIAGYKVGKKSKPTQATPAVTEAIIIDEVPIEPLTDTVEQPQLAVELPTAEPTPELTTDEPTPELTTDEPAPNSFALRAEETIQTLFDKDERPLVAEILEVRADSLKVRRQADGYKLEVPVAMLSVEDQAFAAYLWEQQIKVVAPSASQSGKSEDDLFWEGLFE